MVCVVLCSVVCKSPNNLNAIPGTLEYVTRVSEPKSRNSYLLSKSYFVWPY